MWNYVTLADTSSKIKKRRNLKPKASRVKLLCYSLTIEKNFYTIFNIILKFTHSNKTCLANIVAKV